MALVYTCGRARDALWLLLIPKTEDEKGPLEQSLAFFDELEIYPGRCPSGGAISRHIYGSRGSKVTHFKKIHERTEIPYDEMVLLIIFAGARQNIEPCM